MPQTLEAPAAPAAYDRLGPLLSIREVRGLAHGRAASWHTWGQVVQNRRWHRVAYRSPVLLTPLDDGCDETPRLVWGRDISLGGFSFAHRDPLACRRAAVTFRADGGRTLTLETRLTWCRFTREWTYQSGGLFLGPLPCPPAAEGDWSLVPCG